MAWAFRTCENDPFTLHAGFIFVVNRILIGIANVELDRFHSSSSIRAENMGRQIVFHTTQHISCQVHETAADELDREKEVVEGKPKED